MNNRDRTAPITLARNSPVAQAELNFLFAQIFCSKVAGNRIKSLLEIKTIIFAGIYADTVFFACIPLMPGAYAERLCVDRDYLFDRKVIFLCKRKIPLIMCRNSHYRAFAVAHQHIVGRPQGQLFTGERMGNKQAGVHALLFHRRHIGLSRTAAFTFGDELGQPEIIFCCLGCQRMLGGYRHISCAHQCVGAGGINLEHTGGAHACRVVGKMNFAAVALADPVALHGFHLLRPTIQRVEALQQLLGILSDAKKIHRDVALFHQRAGTPAASVDDLFVGQHGVILRIPVHRGGLLVDDAFLEQAREQPLLPAIIFRAAGSHFARPVDAQPETLQLLAHVIDVVVSPRGGRHIIGHCGIFCGQAERIPAHRLHHIKTFHAVIARQHIADGIVAHVPHMQLAGRIRKHRQTVIFWLVGLFVGNKRLAAIPVLLRLLFDTLGKVIGLHVSLWLFNNGAL